MPGRKIPLICGEYYHVFNRGIDHRSTFVSESDYHRAIETILLYRFTNPPLCLSKFLRLETKRRSEILNLMALNDPQVTFIAHCLMPNHFHFLIRQNFDCGISKFVGNFQNSYTKYFNTRHERDGSLFLDQFKAVRIETEEQLLHVSRYIHLNPFSGHLVNSTSNIIDYPWSSFPEYLGKVQNGPTDRSFIMRNFNSTRSYLQFVLDQADYQRQLKEIEHLVME